MISPKTTFNAEVNSQGIESSDYNIKFKCIKEIKDTFADTLSMLVNLELTELNLPEKEGYEYGYTMFEKLPVICVDSSKHKPAPLTDVSNLNVDVMKEEKIDDKVMIKCHSA